MLELARQVISAFAEALADQSPGVKAEVAKEAAKFGLSMIPVVGPIASQVASAAEIVAENLRYSRSWQAAVIELRRG